LSIKILSEKKRDLLEFAPPKKCLAHLWLNEKTKKKVNNEIKKDCVLDLYVSKRAEAKMRNHALSYRREKKEVMGFILGDFRKWGGRTYAIARDIVTTDLDATNVSVRFDRGGFEKLFAGLDECGFDYVIVGWYHSHPGHGCFMSDTDIETQKKMFNTPWHFAIVIDPVKFDVAAFALRNEKLENLIFAIYWRDFDDPYGGLERLKK
jgi:proteasome lid subunit RPN8/RPN11